jgi:hypothetical protein
MKAQVNRPSATMVPFSFRSENMTQKMAEQMQNPSPPIAHMMTAKSRPPMVIESVLLLAAGATIITLQASWAPSCSNMVDRET